VGFSFLKLVSVRMRARSRWYYPTWEWSGSKIQR